MIRSLLIASCLTLVATNAMAQDTAAAPATAPATATAAPAALVGNAANILADRWPAHAPPYRIELRNCGPKRSIAVA